jgi:hypothetical protein
MRIESAAGKGLVWRGLARRVVDYGLTVGAALICGYWIIEARW